MHIFAKTDGPTFGVRAAAFVGSVIDALRDSGGTVTLNSTADAVYVNINGPAEIVRLYRFVVDEMPDVCGLQPA